MLTKTTAKILCDRGPRSWPAAALIHQARKAAKKKAEKAAKKAASRKAKAAEIAWKQKPAFLR